MKFGGSKYWKRKGVCCEFIEVLEVIEDNGVTALIRVSLNEQLNKSWKTLIAEDRFRLNAKEYVKWNLYRPRGNREP